MQGHINNRFDNGPVLYQSTPAGQYYWLRVVTKTDWTVWQFTSRLAATDAKSQHKRIINCVEQGRRLGSAGIRLGASLFYRLLSFHLYFTV